ncbi:Transcriptional regulatory protein SIN3 [Smittium mucronatum]|uniref:Transcriptional regulatory protein SIN3 n=1 Tax=Smittium mucronatum TaxID=133383 RepID=A0A1R0GLS3_9FUNG|nr:Transcriptional regulatory protein SIN3 [Smittium mucronatum]
MHQSYPYGSGYHEPAQMSHKQGHSKIYDHQMYHTPNIDEYRISSDYHQNDFKSSNRIYQASHHPNVDSEIPPKKLSGQSEYSHIPPRQVYSVYETNTHSQDTNPNISSNAPPPNDQSHPSKYPITWRNANPPKKQPKLKNRPPIPSPDQHKDFPPQSHYPRIPSSRGMPISSINTINPVTHGSVLSEPFEEEQDPNLSDGKPINVKDAMSYLDLVKFQFHNQPEIYNQFLGIMKDFKSNDIDTPGVIDRVSALFAGHPILIQGFNTFLPPGYLIECSENPYAPVRVTTPSNNTNVYHQNDIPKPIPSHPVISQPAEIQLKKANIKPQSKTDPHSNSISSIKPNLTRENVDAPRSISSFESSEQMKSPYNYNNPGNVMYPQNQNPIEFNHAISFVNKIKTRFSNDSERYGEFLDILNSYQRDGEPIANVYEKIRILFSDDEDLLEEFKLFLPDKSQIVNQYQSDAPRHQMQAPPQHELKPHQVVDFEPPSNKINSQLPPLGSFTPVVDENVYPTFEYPNQRPHSPDVKISGHKLNPVTESPSLKNINKKKRAAPIQEVIPNKRRSKINEDQPMKDSQVPPIALPQRKPSDSEKEYIFFEKVKQYLGRSPLYNEFIKLLNLYNQEILDEDDLLDGAEKLIGGDYDLFNWFKLFVNSYKPRKKSQPDLITIQENEFSVDSVSENPKTSELNDDLSIFRPKPILENCKSYGPSYKLLHKIDSESKCSGRDSMCWEVLNDSWVSYPIWASEESEFVHHKKNQYEDALFRCEEDRHEMDINIETNLSLIRVFSSMINQIENMSEDEKSQVNLKTLLNGHSEALFRRALRKIYDSQRLPEILEAFNTHPLVAVTVILKRLKQKDEEWRKQRRVMIKVWREIDSKNFYKSLDHHGLTLKANDRKSLSAKVLISEIESIRLEQLKSNDSDMTSFNKLKHRFQLEYNFENSNIIADLINLVMAYVKKQNSSLSSSEKSEVEGFCDEFFCSFFGDFFEIEKSKFSFQKLNTDDPTSVCSEPSKVENNHGENVNNAEDKYLDLGLSKPVAPQIEDSKESLGDVRASNASNLSSVSIDKNNNTKIEFSRSVSYSNRRSMTPMNLSEVSSMSWVTNGIQNNIPRKSVSDSNMCEFGKKSQDSDDLNISSLSTDKMNKHSKSSESLNIDLNTPKIQENDAEKRKIKDMATSNIKKESRVFYCNSSIYVFIRLFQTLYSRVSTIKKVSLEIQDLSKNKEETVAKKLNIRRIPQVLVEYDLSTIDYYSLMLELVTKQINGSLDSNSFEDSARYLFGPNAHLLLTFDRVVSLISKQVQNLVTDSKSCDLIGLLNEPQVTNNSNLRDYISYRINAQEIVGNNEYVYRFDYLYSTNILTIQLLKPQDSTLDINVSMEDRWAYYVDSYILFEPTEGIPRHKPNAYRFKSFFKKNLEYLNNINKPPSNGSGDRNGGRKRDSKDSGSISNKGEVSKERESSIKSSKSTESLKDSCRKTLLKYPLLPYLKRNINTEDYVNKDFYVSSMSNLEIKIAVNSYKLCFMTNSEDNYVNHSRRCELVSPNLVHNVEQRTNASNKKWNDLVNSKIPVPLEP